MLLEKMTDSGRIVFVSSGTHDPAKKSTVAVPVYENARLLAYPKEMSQNENMLTVGQRRYSTSKLCNIYCTYELAERIKQQTNKNINYIFASLQPNVNTPDKSGKTLASLVTNPELNETTGKYFDGTREIKSSKLSYNKKNREDLWKTSVELSKLNKTEAILTLDKE